MHLCDTQLTSYRRVLTQSLSLTPACLINVGMTKIDDFKCTVTVLNVE